MTNAILQKLDREIENRCCSCGRFISYHDLLYGAKYYFEPDSDRSPEVSEWTCKRCLKDD